MTPDKAPDKARDLLDGTTPAPWEWRWDTGLISLYGAEGEPVATDLDVRNADLIAAAPDMARMIAGMRAEYGVEVQRANGDWLPPYSWHDSAEQARTRVPALHVRGTANRRIVRRYVTTPEEA